MCLVLINWNREIAQLVEGSSLVTRVKLFAVQAVETLCGSPKGTSQVVAKALLPQAPNLRLLMLILRRNEERYSTSGDVLTSCPSNMGYIKKRECRRSESSTLFYICSYNNFPFWC